MHIFAPRATCRPVSNYGSPLGADRSRGKADLADGFFRRHPEARGTFLKAPILRTIVFGALYWGPPLLENYQISNVSKLRSQALSKPSTVTLHLLRTMLACHCRKSHLCVHPMVGDPVAIVTSSTSIAIEFRVLLARIICLGFLGLLLRNLIYVTILGEPY